MWGERGGPLFDGLIRFFRIYLSTLDMHTTTRPQPRHFPLPFHKSRRLQLNVPDTSTWSHLFYGRWLLRTRAGREECRAILKPRGEVRKSAIRTWHPAACKAFMKTKLIPAPDARTYTFSLFPSASKARSEDGQDG